MAESKKLIRGKVEDFREGKDPFGPGARLFKVCGFRVFLPSPSSDIGAGAFMTLGTPSYDRRFDFEL